MSKRRKAPPARIFVVIDGDNGEVLEHHHTRKSANASLDSYNGLAGYEPNCTVVEYRRVKHTDD